MRGLVIWWIRAPRSHKEGLEAPVKTAVDKFQLLPAFLKVGAILLGAYGSLCIVMRVLGFDDWELGFIVLAGVFRCEDWWSSTSIRSTTSSTVK